MTGSSRMRCRTDQKKLPHHCYPMALKQLKYFCAVVDHGSFARQLNLNRG